MNLQKIVAIALPTLFVAKQFFLSMDATVGETGTVEFSHWFWIGILIVELVVISTAVYLLWDSNDRAETF